MYGLSSLGMLVKYEVSQDLCFSSVIDAVKSLHPNIHAQFCKHLSDMGIIPSSSLCFLS